MEEDKSEQEETYRPNCKQKNRGETQGFLLLSILPRAHEEAPAHLKPDAGELPDEVSASLTPHVWLRQAWTYLFTSCPLVTSHLQP